jgi:hypothetical protein
MTYKIDRAFLCECWWQSDFFWSFKVFKLCEYDIKKITKTHKKLVWLSNNSESYATYHKSFTFLLTTSYVGIGSVLACPYLCFLLLNFIISFICVLWSQTRNDRRRKETKTLFYNTVCLRIHIFINIHFWILHFPQKVKFCVPCFSLFGQHLKPLMSFEERWYLRSIIFSKETHICIWRAILTIVKGKGWATDVNIYNVVTIQIRFLASSDPSRIWSGRDCVLLPRKEYLAIKNE